MGSGWRPVRTCSRRGEPVGAASRSTPPRSSSGRSSVAPGFTASCRLRHGRLPRGLLPHRPVDPERQVDRPQRRRMATVSLLVRQERQRQDQCAPGPERATPRSSTAPRSTAPWPGAPAVDAEREPYADEISACAAWTSGTPRALRVGVETAASSDHVASRSRPRVVGSAGQAQPARIGTDVLCSLCLPYQQDAGRAETLSVRPGVTISPSTCAAGRRPADLRRGAPGTAQAGGPGAGRGSAPCPPRAPSPRCRTARGCPRRAGRRRAWPRAAG